MNAVVDTSALVELLAVDPIEASLATRLAEVLPHVPDIIDVEFHHALRGLDLGRKIRPERATQARSLFLDVPKLRFPTSHLSDRIWSLRANFGAYDAAFIALAEVLELPLITCDAKLRPNGLHRAEVECY